MSYALCITQHAIVFPVCRSSRVFVGDCIEGMHVHGCRIHTDVTYLQTLRSVLDSAVCRKARPRNERIDITRGTYI